MSKIKQLTDQLVDQIHESGCSPREVLARCFSAFVPSLRIFEHRKPARAKHYLAFIRERPCIVCGSQVTIDPHHHGRHAMGEKTDDYRCVPLCHYHHMTYHDRGFAGDLEGWSDEDFLEHTVRLLVLYLRGIEGT